MCPMRILRLPFTGFPFVGNQQRLLRTTLAALLGLLALAGCVAPRSDWAKAAKTASSFHFTVTSDLHCKTNAYNCILDAMAAHSAGQGAFQVSVGDVTDAAGQTPAPLRTLINAHFGPDAVWFPAVGNHDIKGGKESTSMQWRREEYRTGNGSRMPLQNLVGRPGPAGSAETTYSWDYGSAHLVVLNEYWSGTNALGSDTGTDGNVVPALRRWLEADLDATRKPFIFVFGHEPAFSEKRHVGNSLDGHPGDRDAFWDVLKKHHVQAFVSGHIHFYYKETHDGVLQICDGNVGQASGENPQTYLDIVLGSDKAEIKVWQNDKRGSSAWHLAETIPLKARP